MASHFTLVETYNKIRVCEKETWKLVFDRVQTLDILKVESFYFGNERIRIFDFVRDDFLDERDW
jgi:hypothetical protein